MKNLPIKDPLKIDNFHLAIMANEGHEGQNLVLLPKCLEKSKFKLNTQQQKSRTFTLNVKVFVDQKHSFYVSA